LQFLVLDVAKNALYCLALIKKSRVLIITDDINREGLAIVP
jgi:hypothetical protein